MTNFMSPPSLFHQSHHNQHPPSHQQQSHSLAEQQQSGTDSSSTSAAATILVRHLPEAIPQDMLSRLFSHYGAFSVRPCAGGKMRNCAFLDFKDESLAFQAQSQLNRLKFLGKVLSAERAGSSDTKKNAESKQQNPLQQTGKEGFSAKNDASSNQGGNLAGRAEPIASRLGVDYPFPPHLEYEYPPPDGNILTNIVNTLIAVPRFYTQVLHLMNKMNLPAPFRMALPTPPLPPPIPNPPPPTVVQPPKVDISSDESELESSDDGGSDTNRRKRVKREAILGPAVDKDIPHEAVGLKAVNLVPKKVPVIKKKNPVLQIKIASKPKMTNDMANVGTPEVGELEQEQVEHKPYASPEDIEKGKLPPEEILSLPMFKNYAAGNPAMVLYIKNLAKDVAHDDFYFIFGSLFENIEAARSGLNIKLMQEGRMRGQAFVTFPSIDLAHRALNMVNGYVFKGKPMIIQFGRNPGAAKAT